MTQKVKKDKMKGMEDLAQQAQNVAIACNTSEQYSLTRTLEE